MLFPPPQEAPASEPATAFKQIWVNASRRELKDTAAVN